MKTLAASLATLIALASSSSAAILASDTFTYADGSLTSNAAWDNHSGTIGDLLVSSGQAVVQHGAPSEDANTSFADQTSGTVYFAIDFMIPDLGAPFFGTDAEYFTHFMTSSGGFVGRMDVSAPTGAGDFTVGIARSASSADAGWATDLSFDTTYLAVIGYDIDNDVAILWIDPDGEGSTNVFSPAGTSSLTLNRIGLRQSDSSENETIMVDNLVVATTFDEAIGVPEPTTALLGALGLLGLIRRRR